MVVQSVSSSVLAHTVLMVDHTEYVPHLSMVVQSVSSSVLAHTLLMVDHTEYVPSPINGCTISLILSLSPHCINGRPYRICTLTCQWLYNQSHPQSGPTLYLFFLLSSSSSPIPSLYQVYETLPCTLQIYP